MVHVTYRIVQHDGGWAYKADGVFSEPFCHACGCARGREGRRRGSREVPGHTEVIEYEDEHGHWHTETASGGDRPATDVKDKP